MSKKLSNSPVCALQKLNQLKRRSRNGSSHTLVSLKVILRVLLDTIRNRPLRVKQIARQIKNKLTKQNPGKLMQLKTIQKRTYDVILVLRAVGILNVFQKEVSMEESQYIALFRLYERIALQRNNTDRQEAMIKAIEQKKAIVQRLKRAKNALQYLCKNKEKLQKKSNKKAEDVIQIKNIIGLVMDKNQLNNNNDILIQKSQVFIRNPTCLLSNLQMIQYLQK